MPKANQANGRIIRLAALTYLLSIVVSGLVCWLAGFFSLPEISFGFITSGILVLLFAAYGFMGQSAIDCDERVQFSLNGTSLTNSASESEGLCVNQLALGMSAGGALTIVSGLFLFFLAT